MANSKRISLVLPLGIYDRLVELANEHNSRPSTHAAYLLKREVDRLWEEKEKSDVAGRGVSD